MKIALTKELNVREGRSERDRRVRIGRGRTGMKKKRRRRDRQE